ncbi:hypothetical protein FPV67DRAFT_1492519 [Lyophyllum atratum]|nr:hypothetical protein FPV67DRAFT_1492519 [Lyophyllum atratum]
MDLSKDLHDWNNRLNDNEHVLASFAASDVQGGSHRTLFERSAGCQDQGRYGLRAPQPTSESSTNNRPLPACYVRRGRGYLLLGSFASIFWLKKRDLIHIYAIITCTPPSSFPCRVETIPITSL